MRFRLEFLIESEARRDWQVRLYNCNRIFVLFINKLTSSSAQHRVDIARRFSGRLNLAQVQRFHNNRCAHILRCLKQSSRSRDHLISTIMRRINVNIRISKVKPHISQWFLAKQPFLHTPIERRNNRRLNRTQILHALRHIHKTIRRAFLDRSKTPNPLGIFATPIELFRELIHVLLLADFRNIKLILLNRIAEFFTRRLAITVEPIQLIRGFRHTLLRTSTLDGFSVRNCRL